MFNATTNSVPCPCCGHCPTCGRRPTYPWSIPCPTPIFPTFPTFPTQPTWTWNNTVPGNQTLTVTA